MDLQLGYRSSDVRLLEGKLKSLISMPGQWTECSAEASRIRADYAAISKNDSPSAEQVARMQAIANRVAENARAEFVEDVCTRKLVTANGKGVVHNVFYDLADQFSIDLSPVGPV